MVPDGLMEGVVSEACGTEAAAEATREGREAARQEREEEEEEGGKWGWEWGKENGRQKGAYPLPVSQAGSQAGRQAGGLTGRDLEGRWSPKRAAVPILSVSSPRLRSFLPNSSRSWMFSNTWFSFSHLGFSGGARVVSLVAPLSILDLWGNAAPVVQLVNTPSLAPRCSFL